MDSKISSLVRYGSLFVVVFQTTATVLLLRYTRTRDEGHPYLPSTAVLSSELCKFVVCVVSFYAFSGASDAFMREIILKPRETLKMAVPSGLYALQNNILYVALTNLDAATYQVTYQLKILTTALFSVLLLRKVVVPMQWAALLMLTFGVALVQLPHDDSSFGQAAADVNRPVGLLAVLTACFSSGFAGAFFEMLVKTGQQTSMVVLNLRMAVFSLVFAFLAVASKDSAAILDKGFFQGYTPAVFVLVLLQAFGGLVVAVVVKYADSILKVFATSISIILSTVCSRLFLNETTSGPLFVAGASLVMFSTLVYGLPAAGSNPAKSKRISNS